MSTVQELSSPVGERIALYRGEDGTGPLNLPVGPAELRTDVIRPSELNGRIYEDRPMAEVRALAKSIKEIGLQERIGVTRDGVIFSGHTRYRACRVLKLKTVPCEVADLYSSDEDEFLRRLTECNRQRVKSFSEQAREHAILYNPRETYAALIEFREAQAAIDGERDDRFLSLGSLLKESRLSDVKMQMVLAVQKVVGRLEPYWPVSVRTIHYELLNDPPMRNTKDGTLYANDVASYKDLADVCKRMRLEGYIRFFAVADMTRKTQAWTANKDVGAFFQKDMGRFLRNYYRDLMQSQPNHIEIVGEKNTVEASIQGIARKYTIPYTLGRGYSSLDPRYKMSERFKASGKERLIILFMTDFDPEGEDIALSFARSMRDHFNVDVLAKKVCLTAEQVKEFNLPPAATAKTDSSRRKGFVEKHGENVWELEAIPTAQRARLLQEAIDSVIDVEAFNAELAKEAEDSAKLQELRDRVAPMLQSALLD